MSHLNALVLGCGKGWHANQLAQAAARMNCRLHFSDYESLFAALRDPRSLDLGCNGFSKTSVQLADFDAILARTMPAGSLQKITFRLSVLHSLSQDTFASDFIKAERESDREMRHRETCRGPIPIVNTPRAMEIAIDKFATLAHVRQLGYAVPETIIVQSRSEAVAAFERLGGDCVVKPMFGGEGRGVMRIQDPQLAWYAFSTLEQLDSVFFIQAFVRPGGRDTRLLVIGDEVLAARRENKQDFRTNYSQGASITAITPTTDQIQMAKRVTASMGLVFASVDLIDDESKGEQILEVNAVPGWKGMQSVQQQNIAELVIASLAGSTKKSQNDNAER